jgi:hypothetical protein
VVETASTKLSEDLIQVNAKLQTLGMELAEAKGSLE